MIISFSQRLRERFPLIYLVTAELEKVDNTGSRELRQERKQVKRIIKEQYRKYKNLEPIRTYERYFSRHGLEFPLSAIYEQVLTGKDIPTFSPLVDAVLLSSLKHRVLLDVKDLDRIEGGLMLDEGWEGEEFRNLKGELMFIQQGDLVLRDEKDIILSWLYGSGEKAKVHRDTKRAVILGLPVPGVDERRIELAVEEAVKLAVKACKAKAGRLEIHKPGEGLEERGLVFERIDPWGRVDVKDYKRLQDEFGIKPIEPLLKELKPHPYFERKIVFGHRDLERILQAIRKRKPWALMTGMMPSGPFHFGHKMVADEIIYWQSQGADVFICIADLEAYGVRKIGLEELRKTALEIYIPNLIALGLKPESCKIYFQSDWVPAYYRLVCMFSRKVTFNEFKDIYGDISPAKIQAALLQSADILHPQLELFGGPKPVLVPVGVDQDPHLRLARDLAERFKEFGFIRPSSTYHKFMRGLKGGKMSSSDPASYISLNDDPQTAKKKLMAAFTGGGGTVKEQREKGGNPDVCTVFDLFKYHLIKQEEELLRIYEECRTGKRICGDCKKQCSQLLIEFLEEHQKKFEKAKEKVKRFLAKV
ncbi:MAG: tryptophan--tRNA ligase [Candidatus Aenigmatarchaeota archaeon]|nr:MAG: tryptophan--tRNA ligase [Candidatus Aenigmarchaeota archaeon]